MILGLFACFVGQSWLVYSDDSGYQHEPLSETAQVGRGIWLRENCQSCHQLFGFGGFMGPDLTNRGHFFPPVAIQAILKAGPKQMPSFEISLKEAEALHDYFAAVNQLGVSQPSASKISEGKFDISKLPWFLYE